jgi:DNA-binding transcriptional ArsR family regulator
MIIILEMTILKETKLSIILHPVRMKVVQALASGHRLTAQQIGERMPGIPSATLYRHLGKLLEAEIITVVEENQVRGTVEKVYGISEHANHGASEEILKATREDQLKYFFTFLVNLLSDFESYISQEHYDLVRDRAGYSQAIVYADDEEFEELVKTIGNAIMRLSGNKPGQGRKARSFTTIVIPQVDDPQN